jgi:hypothetical protein
MTRPEITGLIERLERTSGPDRELDARIWYALHRDEMPHEGDYHFAPTVEDWLQHVAGTGGPEAPRYTGSIDDALTLAKDKCFDLGCAKIKGEYGSYARIYGNGPVPHNWCAGQTPALALCVAALRARGEP